MYYVRVGPFCSRDHILGKVALQPRFSVRRGSVGIQASQRQSATTLPEYCRGALQCHELAGEAQLGRGQSPGLGEGTASEPLTSQPLKPYDVLDCDLALSSPPL